MEPPFCKLVENEEFSTYRRLSVIVFYFSKSREKMDTYIMNMPFCKHDLNFKKNSSKNEVVLAEI